MDNATPATKKVLVVIAALAALALIIVLATAYRSLLRTSVYTPSLTSDEKKIEVSGIFGSDALSVGTHQWKFEAKLSDGSLVTATRDFAIVSPYGASPTPTATVLPYGGG